MGHHVGTPESHSLHGDSNHICVGDSHGLILNNVGSAHHSLCRFSHHLQLYGSIGVLMADMGNESLHRQAMTPLKLGGEAISSLGLEDPGGDADLEFS